MSIIRRGIGIQDLTPSSWAISAGIASSSVCSSWFVTMATWSGTYSFVGSIVDSRLGVAYYLRQRLEFISGK